MINKINKKNKINIIYKINKKNKENKNDHHGAVYSCGCASSLKLPFKTPKLIRN